MKKNVYYDKWNGAIKAITSNILSNFPHIEVELNEVEPYLLGKKCESELIVVKRSRLHKKNNVIYLNIPETTQYKIPTEQDDPDIDVHIYEDNRLLGISINKGSLDVLYDEEQRSFAKIDGDDLVFHLTRNNIVLKTVKVDVDFLINSSISIDISDIDNFDDIEIYTYRIFEKYRFTKSDKFFPIENDINFNVREAKEKEDGFKYHIEVYRIDSNEILVRNNIVNLNDAKIFDSIELYITDKRDPNKLYDKILLTTEDIWKNKDIRKKIDFDIGGKTILFNNRYINICYSDTRGY